jgi:hypothetical protein
MIQHMTTMRSPWHIGGAVRTRSTQNRNRFSERQLETTFTTAHLLVTDDLVGLKRHPFATEET